jgi:CRP-like cAMP-binding protein
MASIIATTSEGQSTEIGVVGREGVVGLEVILGADSSPHESMIQIPNKAYRISTPAIREEFKLCGELQDLVLRFTSRLMVQIGQTTLCNRLHTLDERLSRWLLMCHDRVGGDQLALTQEFLAIMLGVTRVSVSIAATGLQSLGYIKYTRGHINIIDREGLEDATCECYAIVRRAYENGK